MLNKFDPDALEREFKILDQSDHRNLVKTYGAKVGKIKYPDGEEREIAYMAMEFLEKGEFFDYIFFLKSGFTEKMHVIFSRKFSKASRAATTAVLLTVTSKLTI